MCHTLPYKLGYFGRKCVINGDSKRHLTSHTAVNFGSRV